MLGIPTSINIMRITPYRLCPKATLVSSQASLDNVKLTELTITLGTCVSHFENSLFSSIAHNLIGLFVFEFLYTVDTDHLSEVSWQRFSANLWADSLLY